MLVPDNHKVYVCLCEQVRKPRNDRVSLSVSVVRENDPIYIAPDLASVSFGNVPLSPPPPTLGKERVRGRTNASPTRAEEKVLLAGKVMENGKRKGRALAHGKIG